MRRGLLHWLDEADDRRGIRFAEAGETWDFWSHARLARLSRRAACGFVQSGVRGSDVLLLVGCDGPEFVAAFFGALLAGAIPAPVASPLAFQQAEPYRQHLQTIIGAVRPTLAIAQETAIEEVRKAAGSIDDAEPSVAGKARQTPRVLSFAELVSATDEDGSLRARSLGELALVQFTSGSCSQVKGVGVTFAALEANLAMIRRWLCWRTEDAFANWLPFYHDMGLIGGLLCSLFVGCDLWLMRPDQFVRQPLRYLRCFGAGEARLSVIANFGLDLLVRRVRPSVLDGLDFSNWRALVVGAERIDPALLERYHALLAPHGFRREALLPAYGLAEATLAVSGVRPGTGWRTARSGGAPADAAEGLAIVSCGPPLEGVRVSILGEDGAPRPEGAVGEIFLAGPSLATAYQGEDGPSFTTFTADGLRTGDAGFMIGGELFVLGRLGDSMKVRGRTIFGEHIEMALAAAGLPVHRIAVILGSDRGEQTAVTLFEAVRPELITMAEAILRLHVGDARLVLLDVARGTILRTSSGKPRRRAMWRAFAEGRIGSVVPVDRRGENATLERVK